jgi:hypothetical protein
VEYLLRKGSDANAKAEDNTTPLHRAVYVGQAECVTLLLRYGAQPNVVDTAQATALHYAAESGYADCARILLAHKADSNALDSFGSSPLSVAAFQVSPLSSPTPSLFISPLLSSPLYLLPGTRCAHILLVHLASVQDWKCLDPLYLELLLSRSLLSYLPLL